jgi:hypothetical protein
MRRQEQNSHEGQNKDAEEREDALEERRGSPCPGRLPLTGAESDARGDQRTNTTIMRSLQSAGKLPHSLIEVVEQTYTPSAPLAGEGLGKVHGPGDPR